MKMKKNILLLATVITLVSCEKKWDCKCTVVRDGIGKEEYIAFEYRQKSMSDDKCSDYQDEYNEDRLRNEKPGEEMVRLICGG
ncbi:MAG: hypothetical protein K8F30_00740, partial [Taibaiella sp.]|nr:hypothetical protein [Taibaiella sp.]